MSMKRVWISAVAIPILGWTAQAAADTYIVPAAVDFSVRDEGRDGFEQVLEGECCIRATIFTTFRVRGAAEFDLSSLPPGLIITSATLRLVLISGTGDNPADFFAYAADGVAMVGDAERTDLPLASNFLVVSSPVDFSGAAFRSLVESRYQAGGLVGMVFKLTREHETGFRDLEFAANPGSPTNSARLILEASPAPPPPPEVSPAGSSALFTVEAAGPGLLALSWELTAGCDSYRIVSGDLAGLLPAGGVTEAIAVPMQCGLTDAMTTIAEPSGSAFFLIAGENLGGVGSLGSGDAGPRAASPTCP